MGYVAVCHELLKGWSDLAEADSGEVLTARNNLGEALLGNGQVEEAHAALLEGIHHATRANALEGDQVSAMRTNLAQALEDLGRYDESLAL